MQTDHPEKCAAFLCRHSLCTLLTPLCTSRCTHKLSEMPRWLSSAKMETVKKLLEVRCPHAFVSTYCTHIDLALCLLACTGRPGHAVRRDPPFYSHPV